MKRFIPALIFLLFAFEADAEFSGGLLLDSSSNILMNPGGESGMYSVVYGEFSHAPSSRSMVSYSMAGGFIERYSGLQMQSHTANAWYDILSGQNTAIRISADAGLSRYGDVTMLDGYSRGSFRANIKSYLTPSLLVRWEGVAGLRSYKTFDTENYSEAETSLRFDKFLKSRTTLRLQMDAGARRYGKLNGTPVSALYGFSARIAQSFTDYTGLSIEAHTSILSSSTGSGSDNSYIFNRIFLDDRYKYANDGLSAQFRYVLHGRGAVTFRTYYDMRDYGENSMENYDYLPEGGWTETEQGVSLMLAYHFDFIPESLSPAVELYYVDVNASESWLSYSATGLSLRLSF